MNGKRSHNLRVFTNFLAFVLLVVITILLVVAKFVPTSTNLSAVLGEIAKYVAIFLVIVASFWYMTSQRNVVVRIIWVVCSITIVVLMFV